MTVTQFWQICSHNLNDDDDDVRKSRTWSGMEISVPASVIKSAFVQRVRIQSKLQIPAACDEFVIYKELKHTLQHSYGGSPWLWVNFVALERRNGRWIQGFTSEPESSIQFFGGKFEPRFWTAWRPTCLMISFDFCSFEKEFNKNREKRCKSKKMLHLSLKINRIHGRETDSPT